MTPGELLVLIGRAWTRLLLYPGGLTAFALIWLIGLAAGGRAARHARPARPGPMSAGGILAVAAPWLGIALLPLPFAAGVGRQFDAVVTLALLDLPLLLTVASELRSPDEPTWRRGARRVAAALNGAPVLVLALLVLGSGSGALELDALARLPGPGVSPVAVALRWAGAVAVALALPPVLGIGPFHAGPPDDQALLLGLRLRAVGLALLAVLPWLALGDDRPWLLPVPPLVLALGLWGFDRATSGRRALPWARAYLALDLLLLLALLAGATAALQQRLG